MTQEECELVLLDLLENHASLEEAAKFMDRIKVEMPTKEERKGVIESPHWRIFARTYSRRLIAPETPEDIDVAIRYNWVSPDYKPTP